MTMYSRPFIWVGNLIFRVVWEQWPCKHTVRSMNVRTAPDSPKMHGLQSRAWTSVAWHTGRSTLQVGAGNGHTCHLLGFPSSLLQQEWGEAGVASRSQEGFFQGRSQHLGIKGFFCCSCWKDWDLKRKWTNKSTKGLKSSSYHSVCSGSFLQQAGSAPHGAQFPVQRMDISASRAASAVFPSGGFETQSIGNKEKPFKKYWVVPCLSFQQVFSFVYSK